MSGDDGNGVDLDQEIRQDEIGAYGGPCRRMIRKIGIERLVEPAIVRKVCNEARYFPDVGNAGAGGFERKLAIVQGGSGLQLDVALADAVAAFVDRSEERRVGQECVGTCRFGWWPER